MSEDTTTLRFFAVAVLGEEEQYATEEEAQAAAEGALADARDEARYCDGWPEWADEICWGELSDGGERVVRAQTERTVQHAHSEACAPEPEPDDPEGVDMHECAEGFGLDFEEWREYALVAVGGAA